MFRLEITKYVKQLQVLYDIEKWMTNINETRKLQGGTTSPSLSFYHSRYDIHSSFENWLYIKM